MLQNLLKGNRAQAVQVRATPAIQMQTASRLTPSERIIAGARDPVNSQNRTGECRQCTSKPQKRVGSLATVIFCVIMN